MSFHPHIPHFAPVRRFNRPVILNVTVCVAGRLNVLANENAHRVVVQAWRQAEFWHVGEYVVMPDHIHFFCTPAKVDGYPVRRWIGYWKRLAGECDESLKRCFQEDCWDTQMRDLAHYEEKLSYVRQNPVRSGIVVDAQSWPYRGQVNQLVWL
jgi:REP element-mobilizing transposase RayT